VLERLRAEAQTDGRVDSELELLVLSALAQQSGGQLPQAVETLLEVLPQLWTRNLSRMLLDAGPPMGRLIWLVQERLGARGEEELSAWLAAILANCPTAEAAKLTRSHTRQPRDLATMLAEPLSPQEQRVLRLLGAGLSNPEIADELLVSVNTIKTHLQSIYRKLGVTSRREARALLRRS
jgi:LuxR family maltose regulon positive regulatory protein